MQSVSSSLSHDRPLKRTGQAARPKKEEPNGLEFPKDDVQLARNQRPVILLHGTLVEKESIAAYRAFSLEQGHPVDHRTYPSISKGQPIEKSAELASKGINRARQQLAERNVNHLQGSEGQKLNSFFQLDGDLYGAHDTDADKARPLLRPLVTEVAELLGQARLEETFSGKLKLVEDNLEQKLKDAGVSAQKAAKMAAELLDSIAPKAMVVGHSAGGYVGYALTVNPEEKPDKDPFTFDGGNGVAEMMVLSAPIGAGLPRPAPPGILDLGFYNVDAKVLRPMESLPSSQLALLNPFFNASYQAMKNMTKQAFRVANSVTLGMSSPLVHAIRPGNAQVEEGSSFFDTYIKGKQVPEGVSVLAVTSPLDQLCQEERSTVDASQPNAHNFSADLEVSDQDIQRERPTWAHVIMTEKPDAFKRQYAEALLDPKALAKVLHPSNDDGVRYEALRMLSRQIEESPSLLNGPMKKALQAVANERAPFKDSPSYLAYQLLS
jgi:pimeloyl-ACP methyl ester carboxylesterase